MADVAKPSTPALKPNSSISYEFQLCFCKLFRYASPRCGCMSGYKSAAHIPDSGPSADFSTVTLDGNGVKVIDQTHGPENNISLQRVPNCTVHGRTSAQHMSTAQTRSDLCSHTSATSQKAHREVNEYSTLLIPPQQAPLPCSLPSLCTTSLLLCNFLL